VKVIAKHMRSEGIAPQLVLCSSARRARETLDGIALALGDAAEVEVEKDLYHASAGDLVERLRTIPDGVESVMLVGHNPAIEALTTVAGKFPTGALATLAFTSSWHDLDPRAAELVEFVKPKDLG
jgi:phosphohistidine phosphatase